MKNIFLTIIIIAVASCINAQQQVNFTEKFKIENQGDYNIEVNEVKELLIIMIALTNYGLGNDDMEEQDGAYYNRVMDHFLPFKNESIIETFDSLLQASILNYIFLSGNAHSYYFEKDSLIPSDVYILPGDEVAGVKIEVNPITTYRSKIEEFAKKSHYREFYKSEHSFYERIIADYQKYADLTTQWFWLEENFKTKINSYVIYCSTLINGLNYTGGFEHNGFQLIEMVLPAIEKIEGNTEKQNEAFNTRIIFTEIDHNYTRQPSLDYQSQIDSAFSNRKKWVNTEAPGTEYYPDQSDVFNEYMTYGTFILFAEDLYSDDCEFVEQLSQNICQVMTSRGFINMYDFLYKLRKLRRNNKEKMIDDLYPELIAWCAKQ